MIELANVYGPRAFPLRVAQDIAQRYPEALIIFHPLHDPPRWQLYERREGMWDARRLYTAIVTCREHERDEEPELPWWTLRGAPRIVDEWFRPPGAWLLAWLAERDLWHRGGHRAFMHRWADMQDRKRAAREARRLAWARRGTEEGYRHIRDALRGDPLAGKRKWVQTVPALSGQ